MSIREKIDAGKIFNCKNFNGFIDSIIEILKYKGVSMSSFYICEVAGVRFLTKLSFYRKSPPELYNRASKKSLSHVDTEIMILKILLKNIILKGVSPCIIELVYEKRCSNITYSVKRKKCDVVAQRQHNTPYENVTQLLCSYSDLVTRGLALDKCAFIVLEKCDITLDEYLRKTVNTPMSITLFRSLLFQIIYTIYAINKIYPGFRHYDLHTENVMLKIDYDHKFHTKNPKYMQFEFEGKTRHVPYFGIIVKIIDFGFSQIPEEGIISVATDDLVNMFYRSKNDLLFLFYWINRIVENTQLDQSGSISEMLRSLEPNESYVSYQTEYIRRIESKIPSYLDMVTNKIFDDYLTPVDASPICIYGSYKV